MMMRLSSAKKKRLRCPTRGKKKFSLEQLEDRRVLATFTVTNLDDAGAGSLRQAVEDANSLVGADEIQFDNVQGTISLTSGQLQIFEELVIDGPGAGLLEVNANGLSRVMLIDDVQPGYNPITIRGLTLTGGNATDGGGISASDTFLTLDDVIVSGNTATATGGGGISVGPATAVVINNSQITSNVATNGPGGGVASSGYLTSITNSSVDGNTAFGDGGGGIWGESSGLSVADSVISSNTAGGSGGGIRLEYGTAFLTGSTVTGNVANAGSGGGISSDGGVSVTRSTLSQNSASSGGGGVYAGGYDGATFVDSTVSGNTAGGSGGGVNVFDGIFGVTLNNTTVNGNQTIGDFAWGGGVYSYSGGTISNSTISGNSTAGANALGGGVGASGFLSINNSTVVANNATVADGGGVARTQNTPDGMTVSDSIIADNMAAGTASDIVPGQVGLSVDFSLIGNADGLGIGGTNLIGTAVMPLDPMLAALADNGGITATHALLPGSPAVNAGDPTAMAGVDNTPEFDQRGSGFNRVVGGLIDMGAFEANPPVVRDLGQLPMGMSSQAAQDLRAVENVFYRFDLLAGVLAANGDLFVIDTFGSILTDGGFGENDTEIGLYNAAGDLIEFNDDIGGNRESRLAFGDDPSSSGDLPAGTYYLAIGAFNTQFGFNNFEVSSISDAFGTVVVNFDLNATGTGPDFNNDGILDGSDLDLLQDNIVNGPPDPATFDLTGDDLVDIADRDLWLAQAGATNLTSGNPYLLGDTNLDGVVDGLDFILWNDNKFTTNSAWTAGDFNVDGLVDGLDFILWNDFKFQSADSIALPPTIAPAETGTSEKVQWFAEFESESDKDGRDNDRINHLVMAVFADWR